MKEPCDCGEAYNCCDCGGRKAGMTESCGCRYCWSCNACEECNPEQYENSHE